MNKPPLIEVQNLSTSFGEQEVLKDISFEVSPNEITVILGKSGSGKTTILKNLIGLYLPDKGRIRIMDYELNSLSEDEFEVLSRKFGVLFQNGALLNSMTVSENISMPLEQHTLLPWPVIDNLVDVKLQLVGLENARYLFPAQLSGGMRKRAALARALALDPPLLFCDEPSAGLDPVTLSALDRLFLKLKDDLGITIVLVTHEVPSILRLADKILFLEGGRLLFSGTLDDARSAGIQEIDRFFDQGGTEQ